MCSRTTVLALGLALSPHGYGQVCRLSVSGFNQSRRVTGAIHAECPEEIVHTAPFGNWGVTSNFGSKSNGHQFDGWCHNTRVCDNTGTCMTDCTDGWYEWNSCTDNRTYQPPNCTLYNASDCKEQATTTGINVHGTKYVDVPVRCPSSSKSDGVLDQGGCADVKQFSSGTNFLSLYELDPICCDALVQTVYFPELTVQILCDVFGCAPAGSEWVKPAFWDSPATPAKVTAELAVAVNWGGFVDANRSCAVSASAFSVVSSASYAGPNVAPESIASAFGVQLAPATAQATQQPLPTSLGGISVSIKDALGRIQSAPLLYVSPRQVNFIVPPLTAPGPATATTFSGEVVRSSTNFQVERVAPALFTANQTGNGVAAAMAVRISPDGTATEQPVFQCTAGPGACTPLPIDLGNPLDRNYLLLFGTGIRARSAVTAVGVVIDGANATVEYAGPQNQYVGLDQVNVVLPNELKGRGTVDVMLTVDSKPANTVTVAFR